MQPRDLNPAWASRLIRVKINSMESIAIETVEKVWDEVSNMEPENAEKLIKKMETNQPALLAYLVARGEEFLNEEELGDFLFLGSVVYRCFDDAGGVLRQVTPEMLESLEKRTFGAMDEAAAADAEKNEAELEEMAIQIASSATQQPLLETVLGYMMEGISEIHPDRQGIAFFLLKIAVESLDQGS